MIDYTIYNTSREPLFTAQIDCDIHTHYELKRRLAVLWAIENKESLKGAVLMGAALGGLYLRNIDLSKADLWGADLEGADVRGTNLQQAFLFEADLTDLIVDKTTILKGAEILGAAGLTPEIRSLAA